MPLGGNKVAESSSSSTSSSSKIRRRQKNSSDAASTAVMMALANSALAKGTMQAAYDISRNVFAGARPGFLPPPPSVVALSEFLKSYRSASRSIFKDALTPQDLGLDASMPIFRADAGGQPKVTYLHFADSPQFTLGVFCLPESAVIPLHNHPGMTVFSKILLGSMHIKSYDWVKPTTADAAAAGHRATSTPDGARLAKLNTDAVYDASSETVALYPEDGGNLHRFTATAPCAVLDVMGPPYCRDQGRDCSYYRVVGTAAGGDRQYAWLKEVPCSFEMDTICVRLRIRR